MRYGVLLGDCAIMQNFGPDPKMQNLKADLHVHTVSSGHGYSTVREICEVASRKGMEMVAITDHGPAMPGAPHLYHFSNLISLPRVLYGVKILRSVECNIIDTGGNLDVSDKVLERLDIVHAGLHPFCGYEGDGPADNTSAAIKAIESGRIDVLVHPGNPLFPLDYPSVVETSHRRGVLIEVNNSSFTLVRRGSEENCTAILGEVRRVGSSICVGSDAHEAELVGSFDEALRLIDEAGIPGERIVNRDADSVLAFLRSAGKEIAF